MAKGQKHQKKSGSAKKVKKGGTKRQGADYAERVKAVAAGKIKRHKGDTRTQLQVARDTKQNWVPLDILKKRKVALEQVIARHETG
jgi:hypothetical protein